MRQGLSFMGGSEAGIVFCPTSGNRKLLLPTASSEKRLAAFLRIAADICLFNPYIANGMHMVKCDKVKQKAGKFRIIR